MSIKPMSPAVANAFIGGFALVGVVAIAVGCAIALNRVLFVAGSLVTDATVTSVEERAGNVTSVYQPTFRFETDSGEVTVTTRVATSEWDFAEGQTIQVRYDPDDPPSARPTGSVDLWLIPSVVIGVGVTATVSCAAIFFALRAQSAAAQARVAELRASLQRPES